MDDKGWTVWATIWIALTVLLFIGVVSYADITTAPVDNVVRLAIGSSSGTGFLLGDGRMITAKHVVQQCEMVMMAKYSDGTLEIIKKEQIRMSDNYDIAVIEVKRKGKQLTIFDDDLYVGFPIYTISMPFSEDVRFGSVGVIGSKRTTLEGRYTWRGVRMADIHVVGGMSGGPVFNNDDQVVGIIVASSQTIAVIVDNKTILEFLDETKTKQTKEVQGN